MLSTIQSFSNLSINALESYNIGFSEGYKQGSKEGYNASLELLRANILRKYGFIACSTNDLLELIIHDIDILTIKDLDY